MRYFSRPFEVQAAKWTDVKNPPMGIYDPWETTHGTTYGYLPSPSGDKTAWLGCWVVRYPSGDTIALSEEEFNLRFSEGT